ncbi:MAG: DUF853 domain-containing protein [Oscillospiraceae bacterium]|nr:DUF853 domain-containing protein [Oscillospiraceae bacterium]
MYTQQGVYLGLAGEKRVHLDLSMANRHGLIAGASGTGKTITMKVLAESFSDAGVPVFLCDIKGDVSGLAEAGEDSEGMQKRIDRFGIRDNFAFRSYPVTFWDVYQQSGHAVRAAVSDMGPELLARILSLTDAQQGVLDIIFHFADDHGLLLTDLKDLKAMVRYVGEHRTELLTEYGNVSPQSLGGITRALIPLEAQGGDLFFGEPTLDIMDLMRREDGRGVINLLDCVKLARNPKLYATFLLWLMSELFERLPEVGDLEEPKLVFFFDEAHMLFSDAPRLLVQKIEQMVKLIRSKGVGIWFVTQSPSDIPDSVLAQLSGRVQHALRAYTPSEQRAVRAAANSLRPNPAFRTEDAITALGVGEALVSLLQEDGVPGVTELVKVICPQSRMAPCDDATRRASMQRDGMDWYDNAVDGDSAYEVLQRKHDEAAEQIAQEKQRAAEEKERIAEEKQRQKELAAEEKQRQKELAAEEKRREREEAAAERKREREEEAAARKREREEERRIAAEERKVERRKSRIEQQVISTGAQIIKRGLMNTIFGGKK